MAHFEPREIAADHILAAGWIRQLAWLTEIDSTNSEARRALAGATHLPSAPPTRQVGGTYRGWGEVGGTCRLPAVWVADRQTAGRGRSSNSWWSPSGCLMLSLAVGQEDLPADPSLRPLLSLVVGVALLKAAEHLTDLRGFELKWPNDLYTGGKKTAGILIEAVPEQSSMSGPAWIIGIGLNVDLHWSEAPPEIAAKAVCLSRASGRVVPMEDALVELIASVQGELLSWRFGSWDWLDLWNDRSLLSGKVVRLRLPTGELIIGRCEGIDQHGRLLLRDQSKLHTVGAAEILQWDSNS